MAVLVIADHDGKVLRETVFRVLGAARRLAEDVDVLVIGAAIGEVSASAAMLDGVRAVFAADAESLTPMLAEDVASIVVPLMRSYEALVMASNSNGKNCLPRIAALLDAPMISDVTAIVGAGTFVRPIYAGSAYETVRARGAKMVVTARAAAFELSSTVRGLPPAPIHAVVLPPATLKVRVISETKTDAGRPDLATARVVVAGGRALGSPEEFRRVVGGLADELGGAVGASRAAVDAGYVPNDCQIGQTGTAVAPDLYIAIGISGAVQHLAGMKDSKVIVAINKDPEAPIFHYADYGIVSDYRTAVPEFMEALRGLSPRKQKALTPPPGS